MRYPLVAVMTPVSRRSSHLAPLDSWKGSSGERKERAEGVEL